MTLPPLVVGALIAGALALGYITGYVAGLRHGSRDTAEAYREAFDLSTTHRYETRAAEEGGPTLTEKPSERRRRVAEERRHLVIAERERERAERGLPPYECWRDHADDPYCQLTACCFVAVPAFLLAPSLFIPWGLAASGAVVALAIYVIRRTDPREKREG